MNDENAVVAAAVEAPAAIENSTFLSRAKERAKEIAADPEARENAKKYALGAVVGALVWEMFN